MVCIGQQGKTGQHDAAQTLQRLEQAAAERLGLRGPAYRWSAQHFHSPDHLPYIGTDASGLHIATGFATDGLTYGTLAAQLITDRILGRVNAWQQVYRADRLDLGKSAKGLFEESASAAKAAVHDLVHRPGTTLEHLQRGQAAIVSLDGDRVAAYRSPDGTLHVVQALCTHMRCQVRWNTVETSWDCPCHGSRFAPDGRVIEGPAMQPLRPVHVERRGG